MSAESHPYTPEAWAKISGQSCLDCGRAFTRTGPIAVFTLGAWRHLRDCAGRSA